MSNRVSGSIYQTILITEIGDEEQERNKGPWKELTDEDVLSFVETVGSRNEDENEIDVDEEIKLDNRFNFTEPRDLEYFLDKFPGLPPCAYSVLLKEDKELPIFPHDDLPVDSER